MRVAAVDLGATSGRVVVGEVGGGRVRLAEVRRFPNGPVDGGGVLRWDTGALFAESEAGLRDAGRLDGIGIDSWAVDYGLLDADGALLAPPAHHRDGRTAGMPARVHALVPEEELYAVNGVQSLPFTTVYQLAAETDLDRAETLLLVPDLLVHHLTGAVGAERTNASTTGLYDVRAGEWALGVAERVGVPGRLLPPLRSPGEVLGTALGAPVVAVGSHDTASAVLGVPARPDRPFAYLSSGTWSLIGVELERPLLTGAARLGGFGNEAGVDGTTRLLRNVMGLWVLTEALRAWGSDDLAGALAAAAHAPAFGPVVDVDAPAFLPPGDMPGRIAAACRASGQREPGTRGEVVRCVLESLALAYRRALRGLERVTGTGVEVLHVVGGGARNDLLCALTADACGVPVVAGPVEATALGNVLVQARALGADLPDRWAVRELVAASTALRVHRPGDGRAWDAAEARAEAAGVWG